MGNANEEIGRCLSIGGLIAHINKVLPRLVSGTKVRHAPLVNNGHFVKKLINIFGGLVYRHDGRDFRDIRGNTECTSKL